LPVRHEKEPEILHLDGDSCVRAYLLARRAAAEGFGSIAIITKTAKKAEEIYKKNKTSSNEINYIDTEETLLGKGISLIPSYFAKGLEFDCVIVPDADSDSYYDEEDRKILYMICSRALHRLYVCYENELTKLICVR